MKTITELLSNGLTSEALKDRYAQLCAYRDSVNEQTASLQKQLDSANKKAEQAKIEADSIAAKIQEKRGGKEWLALKKEIALLAKALSGK